MGRGRIGRRVALVAGLAVTGAFAASGALLAGADASPAPAAHAAGTHTVTLRNLSFNPGTVNIRRGESVRWVWGEREEHNITFSHHGPRSRTMTSGSYTLRFTHSGTFGYVCTIHVESGMRGKIVVH